MSEEEKWIPYIRQACQGLDYGTVTLVIHNGQIAQIERLEKFRFQSMKEEKGGLLKRDKLNTRADQTH
ncbi:YezD family protein [Sporosarcina cascadiensis]|uniref:YezD family protein n=1 Tax=Sporosarcina cascadiensis TaxID=2660747 RepID=UPI00129B728D|nr:YezD family protein [Sporosarcina cascadiensis]